VWQYVWPVCGRYVAGMWQHASTLSTVHGLCLVQGPGERGGYLVLSQAAILIVSAVMIAWFAPTVAGWGAAPLRRP
jgi:hypothetical protein